MFCRRVNPLLSGFFSIYTDNLQKINRVGLQ